MKFTQFKKIISQVLLLISYVLFLFFGILLCNNSANNFNSYLHSLTQNRYESYILKSDTFIGDETIPSYYKKELESQIGVYSQSHACTFSDSVYSDVTLIKTKKYNDDFYYNSFGVLTYEGIANNTWINLKQNEVFIGLNFARSLCSQFDLNLNELLLKNLFIDDNQFIIGGIFYSDRNTLNDINFKAKGNVFDDSFGNVIFIHEDYNANFLYNSFLIFVKNSKVDSYEIFNFFKENISNSHGNITFDDAIINYTFDKNIRDKVDSLLVFHEQKKNKNIALLIFPLALILFGCSLYFLNELKFNKNTLLFYSYLLLQIIFVMVLCFVATKMHLRTVFSVPVAFNNRLSVSLIICALSIYCLSLILKNREVLKIKKINKKIYECFI